jgi:hypothetical protein
MEAECSIETLYLPTDPHDVTNQKNNNIDIFSTVRNEGII